jgi:hypothetical protein
MTEDEIRADERKKISERLNGEGRENFTARLGWFLADSDEAAYAVSDAWPYITAAVFRQESNG